MRAALVLALSVCAAAPAWAADAMALLEAGQVDAGTELTAEVIADSQDALERLTYASILFYRDRGLLRSGAPAAALFKEVESELTQAIALSAADPQRRRDLTRGQAAFMLGDVQFFVRQQPASAKAFYLQALRYMPGHAGAIEALKQLP